MYAMPARKKCIKHDFILIRCRQYSILNYALDMPTHVLSQWIWYEVFFCWNNKSAKIFWRFQCSIRVKFAAWTKFLRLQWHSCSFEICWADNFHCANYQNLKTPYGWYFLQVNGMYRSCMYGNVNYLPITLTSILCEILFIKTMV